MSWATTLANVIGVRGFIGIIASITLGTLLGLQLHKTHVEHASAVAWELKYDGEHAAFQQTIINYSKAADAARAADEANIERARSEQAQLNTRTLNEYEARLAAARADARRLSSGPASVNLSGPRTAPLPDHVGPATGADGSAAEDGLPGFGLADRLTATEQAIQLDELIKWVKAQMKVLNSSSSPNASSSPNSKPSASGAPSTTSSATEGSSR